MSDLCLSAVSAPYHRLRNPGGDGSVASYMRFFVVFLLFATACGPIEATSDFRADSVRNGPLQISMSLYVVDDADGRPESSLSSNRSLAEVSEIAERMKTIWDQAGIDLVIETVARIEASADVVAALGAGDTSSFINRAASGAISIPAPGTINGFYVARIGTANGMTPFGTRLFFVADNPSVDDERVSSHEIGHILGLHHALDDANRLMFSGTNGTDLTDQEITVARYSVSGVLDGRR